MRHICTLILLCLASVVSVSAQTARDYFNELKAANTFNRYQDEYVCFRDDVIAKISDVIENMKKAGNTEGIKTMLQEKDSLVLQTYFKGVAGKDYVYEPVGKDPEDSKEYSLEFEGQYPGKMVYTINWVTGRYLQRLYMYQKSRALPYSEGSGKCELIHPKQQ